MLISQALQRHSLGRLISLEYIIRQRTVRVYSLSTGMQSLLLPARSHATLRTLTSAALLECRRRLACLCASAFVPDLCVACCHTTVEKLAPPGEIWWVAWKSTLYTYIHICPQGVPLPR